MKKFSTLLLLSLAGLSIASAQTPVSQLYKLPLSGMQQLRRENPYIRVQHISGNTWEDYQLFQRQKAPNIDSTSLDLTSDWQPDNTWKNSMINKDSFILDNQGRVAVHIEDDEYIFTTTSYRSKTKYVYTYGNWGKISKIRLQYAEPATSNNYSTVAEVFPLYDQNGRRMYDSTYLYGNGNKLHDDFIYDNNGLLTNQFTLLGTDTIRKIYLTYSGQNIATAFLSTFDQSTDEWSTSGADTLTYDAQNRPLSHVHWGLVYYSGDPVPKLNPLSNEQYHYTASGKLDEIIYQNSQWSAQYKIVVEYDNTGKPIIANEYSKTSGGWSTESLTRYLFEIPTGIDDPLLNKVSVSVYPNPCYDRLTIELDRAISIQKTSLYDVSGKCVYTSTKGERSIDLATVDNGIYYLNLITTQGVVSQKIVVQH